MLEAIAYRLRGNCFSIEHSLRDPLSPTNDVFARICTYCADFCADNSPNVHLWLAVEAVAMNNAREEAIIGHVAYTGER